PTFSVKPSSLEEATCSICLEYLTEPVTIDCGHNFCRACITRYSERRRPQSGTKFPCPDCRALFQKGNFRPNRQLANIIESIKPLRLQPGQAQNENLCETHKEKLQLFCKEDGKATCVVPREEVAQGYKVGITAALGEGTNGITREFKKLHQVLSEEEQLLLWRLAADERETLQRLQDNITKLSEQSTTLINLITELQEKCLQPAAELLQVRLLTTSPSSILQHQTLQSVTRSQEFTDSVTFSPMDVTLDPDTAHPNLVLSQDRKRVRHKTKRQNLPNNPERFDPCVFVLGAEGFTGGRHYWEVEVGDKTRWKLGVCKESVNGRQNKLDCGVCRESVIRTGKVRLTPGNGHWAVWLRDGKYEACTSSPRTPLAVSVRPRRVGIFLDYEAGEVSFYNVTDRSLLFTFTDTFSGTLRPYFYVGYKEEGKNTAPLTICPVPAQAGGNLCP
uniref:Uncharacterized protein n=1 Tax=Chrysemys picta bellii TaxID=8478 RepID=A0A8C3FDD6_CHRPI